MAESLTARIAAIWLTLARRNNWELIRDPAILLDQVAARLAPREPVSDHDISFALTGAYGEYLYRGLEGGQEDAAQELWLICRRAARGRGLDEGQATAAAQEAVTRMLSRLETLQKREVVISYTLSILNTVIREQFQIKEYSLDAGIAAQSIEEPVELAETADMIEQKIVNQQIVSLLQSKLPNPLERIVLIRIVLLGDKPRDVARDLNLPLSRTRIAKHRALQRLRADEAFMDFCRSLRDTDAAQQPPTPDQEEPHDN